MIFVKIILCFSLLSISTADYSSTDDVVELDSSNFKSKVLDSDELWLVEFYAPWCGHCQRLEPEWKKAASNLKGVTKIAFVDFTKYKHLVKSYNISKPGEILSFQNNKNKPVRYKGNSKFSCC